MAFEGLAKGLLSAGEAFNQGYEQSANRELAKQKMAQEEAMRKRAMKLELAGKNMIETPEGEFALSDEGKRDLNLQRGIKTGGLLDQGIEIDQETGTARIADWKKTQTESEIALKKAQARRLLADANKENEKSLKPPTNKQLFESLPKENQEQINVLAKNRAVKLDSYTKFDEIAKILDDASISYDQKVQQAESMLKTLNDPLNPDALVNAEADRASYYLKFNVIPNLTKPGDVFGRSMDGFAEQIRLSKQKLLGAADTNQKQIDKLYGRNNQGLLSEGDNQSGLGDNKVMIQDVDGKRYYIDPKFLDAAIKDGAKRIQ